MKFYDFFAIFLGYLDARRSLYEFFQTVWVRFVVELWWTFEISSKFNNIFAKILLKMEFYDFSVIFLGYPDARRSLYYRF
tara:strand:+ start:77 stop:316 length:240 start_codon:yes stop_codon:yes gene_type:complete